MKFAIHHLSREKSHPEGYKDAVCGMENQPGETLAYDIVWQGGMRLPNSLKEQAEADQIEGVLELLYEASQNTDGPWREHEPCRSTSVGDKIELNEKMYLVKGVGFEEVK